MQDREMARDKQINFRVSEEEAARFDRVAAHFGLSLAAMLRMLVKEKDDEIRAKRNVDEAEAFDVACIAYARHCDREGLTYQQPSFTSSGFEGGEFVLRNSRGELARFTVSEDGKLRIKK
jgi:hypothetical protein